MDPAAEARSSLVRAIKGRGSSGFSSLIPVTRAPSRIPSSRVKVSKAVTRPPEVELYLVISSVEYPA